MNERVGIAKQIKGASCALSKRAMKCAVKSCCCMSQCEYPRSVRMSRQERKKAFLLSASVKDPRKLICIWKCCRLKVNARYLEQTGLCWGTEINEDVVGSDPG